MESGFFPADLPAAEPAVEPRRERTPSFEPSADELPAPFAVSEVIARGENLVIALTGVRIFSDGVELLTERHLRRGTADERGWREMHGMFAEHWGRAPLTPERLRWGLVLGDGTRLFAEDRFGAPADGVDGGASVRVNGGSGSGDDHRYTMRSQLWLHPLPPEGPLELVVQWPAFGIPESRVILDGGAMSALAASVRPLWG
ncbi:hypothetical protein SAMN04487788_3097 [Microbacterium testaceum StLB037]|jgi:hypothetical protein|uniref:Uncharacterized protein n=1 Tax=Microbacterium testaceum (strain StLB037) TaxID=979556 RepID=A0A1H0RVV9_MICTS|nr:hypothetical protein [Microbacterium testaceum]SDP33530.1 hypothetical protein SAMN04487788_3097 [Microbacterium testaceum StLB037]